MAAHSKLDIMVVTVCCKDLLFGEIGNNNLNEMIDGITNLGISNKYSLSSNHIELLIDNI